MRSNILQVLFSHRLLHKTCVDAVKHPWAGLFSHRLLLLFPSSNPPGTIFSQITALDPCCAVKHPWAGLFSQITALHPWLDYFLTDYCSCLRHQTSLSRTIFSNVNTLDPITTILSRPCSDWILSQYNLLHITWLWRILFTWSWLMCSHIVCICEWLYPLRGAGHGGQTFGVWSKF